MHGGRQKRGAEHHAYQHGRRSRFAPPGELGQIFERVLEHGDLLDGSDRVALLMAREVELVFSLAGVDSPEKVGEVWERILSIDAQLDRATRTEVDRQSKMRELIPAATVFVHMRALVDANMRAIREASGMSREQQEAVKLRIMQLYRTYLGERLAGPLPGLPGEEHEP
jgi:hypothetical protein